MGLAIFYHNVIEPFAIWLIEIGLPPIINAIATALKFLTDVNIKLRPVISTIFNEILLPSFAFIADNAGGIASGILGYSCRIVGIESCDGGN